MSKEITFQCTLCDVCGTASHTDDCTSPYAVSARARKVEEEKRTPSQKERLKELAKVSRTYMPFAKIREMVKMNKEVSHK